MLTIYVLFNEIIHKASERGKASDADEAAEQALQEAEEIGLHRTNESVAPMRVIMALVREPLRVYRDVSKENPSLVSAKLDKYLAVPERITHHNTYRNSVFHVDTTPRYPESRDLMITDSDYTTIIDLDIFSELSRVLLFSLKRD